MIYEVTKHLGKITVTETKSQRILGTSSNTKFFSNVQWTASKLRKLVEIVLNNTPTSFLRSGAQQGVHIQWRVLAAPLCLVTANRLHCSWSVTQSGITVTQLSLSGVGKFHPNCQGNHRRKSCTPYSSTPLTIIGRGRLQQSCKQQGRREGEGGYTLRDTIPPPIRQRFRERSLVMTEL